MQTVIDLIGALRNIRTQWNMDPKETMDAFVVPVDRKEQELVTAYAADVRRMARLKDLTVDTKAPALRDCATALVGQIKVFVPLDSIVDLAKEKKKMADDIAQKTKAIQALEGRLKNEAFVFKAPADVIAKERERLEILTKEIVQLKQVLTNLK